MIDFVICVNTEHFDKIGPLVQSIRDHHSCARINLITEAGAECDFVDRIWILPYSYLYQKQAPYDRINLCTYFRFWIHYAWPDIERCIYLDWDTLVMGDMSDELDGDYVIKGVSTNRYMNLNAGVIYFNFTNPQTLELIEVCRKCDEKMDDQRMLNKYFEDKITPISIKYNYLPMWWGTHHEDVRCIHYLGYVKPWDISDMHMIWLNKKKEYDSKHKKN